MFKDDLSELDDSREVVDNLVQEYEAATQANYLSWQGKKPTDLIYNHLIQKMYNINFIFTAERPEMWMPPPSIVSHGLKSLSNASSNIHVIPKIVLLYSYHYPLLIQSAINCHFVMTTLSHLIPTIICFFMCDLRNTYILCLRLIFICFVCHNNIIYYNLTHAIPNTTNV